LGLGFVRDLDQRVSEGIERVFVLAPVGSIIDDSDEWLRQEVHELRVDSDSTRAESAYST